MKYYIGDRIKFSYNSDRLPYHQNTTQVISGTIIEVTAPGRYTVKADSGFEYYCNQSMIISGDR